MEKVMFICVFSHGIIPIVCGGCVSEAEVLRVTLKESISLSCNMTDRHEISWYHLSPASGRLTLLMSARTSTVVSRKLLVTYNGKRARVTLTADSEISSVSLLISGLSESDLGLYFCGTKAVTSEMNFNKPFRLQTHGKLTDREDKHHSVTEPPKDVESTDEVTLLERVLMFGGVALAISVFFLTTFVAGGIIHHHGWQKGWSAAKRSTLRSHKSLK